MFRLEFLNILTNLGVMSSKDFKDYTSNKDIEIITEFELLKNNLFDAKKASILMANHFQLKYMDLSQAKVSDAILNCLNRMDVIQYRSIPLQRSKELILLAIYDPSIIGRKDALMQLTKSKIDFILTDLLSWSILFHQIKINADDLVDKVEEVKGTEVIEGNIKAEDIGQEIVAIVNKILVNAYIKKASDIHVEPYEHIFRIRYRIDGKLETVDEPKRALMLPIISRIKIMAKMDIAERRRPQDGRIKIKVKNSVIDFRVSSLPTLFGEKIVLRLLDNSNLQLDMTKLGLEPKQLEIIKTNIHKPFGMCLVTGPTGSGKTTTLYSALSELNTPDSNISTAEDPVEFNLAGINQVNVKKDIGLTFASALKAFLRQDPDIIMVGEIRDYETGEIAVEAALTGHMVLSTLHTNDSTATISRLLNMGIEPFLIVAALNVIVAQRLCRKICTKCKTEAEVTKDYLISCGFSPSSAEKIKVFRGAGCEICNGSGHKGRIAIYEVLHCGQEIKEAILKGLSSDELKKVAIRAGLKTLRMSALTKVAQGMTTLEEAMSNSGGDHE